jgi:hypothetical protein
MSVEEIKLDPYATHYLRNERGTTWAEYDWCSPALKDALVGLDSKHKNVKYGKDPPTGEDLTWSRSEYPDADGNVKINIFRKTESEQKAWFEQYKKDHPEKFQESGSSSGQQTLTTTTTTTHVPQPLPSQHPPQQQQYQEHVDRPAARICLSVSSAFYWEDREGWDVVKRNCESGWKGETIKEMLDGTFTVILKRL